MPKTELIESLRTVDMLLKLAAIGEAKALVDAHSRVDTMITALLNEEPAYGCWQPEATAPLSGAAPKDHINLLVTYPSSNRNGPFVFTAHRDELGWDTGVWRLHETPWAWMLLPEPAKERL